MKELILGGVRSGKSRLAEQRARSSGLDVVYIATATAGDDEMRARIEQHRVRRPAQWRVIEEPLYLASVLDQHAHASRCIVVDCVTLWLTNWLCTENAAGYAAQRAALLEKLPALPGHIIFVANETNLGIMPMGDLTRRFCDEAGMLHQALAAKCERVMLTIAGLPLYLKGECE